MQVPKAAWDDNRSAVPNLQPPPASPNQPRQTPNRKQHPQQQQPRVMPWPVKDSPTPTPSPSDRFAHFGRDSFDASLTAAHNQPGTLKLPSKRRAASVAPVFSKPSPVVATVAATATKKAAATTTTKSRLSLQKATFAPPRGRGPASAAGVHRCCCFQN